MSTVVPDIPNERRESFASDFAGMGSFFIDPTGAARYLFHKLFWIGPVIVVSIISLIVGVLMMPIMQHAMANMPVPANANPEQFQKGVAMSLTIQHIATYLTPLIVIAVMALESLLIWASASVMGISAKFGSLFNLMAGCSLITVLSSIASIVILKAKGDVSSMAELRPPMGLDIFLGEDANKMLLAFLGYFSVFEIWWIVMAVLIFSAAFKTSKGKAIAAVAPIVVLSLAFRLAGAAFQK